MNAKTGENRQAKRRMPSLLDEVLERRMLLYVLAAGATLAGASSAQAGAVFTRSNAVLSLESKHLSIDMNNDGTTDFVLTDECFSSTSCFGGVTMYAKGEGENGVEAGNRWAIALFPGSQVGPAEAFKQHGDMLAGGSYFGGRTSSYGPFAHTRFRSLGVKFLIKGQVHYGWIGFRSVNNFAATLIGWAYESEANTPIRVGQGFTRSDSLSSAEPTSLQLLAAGHVAVADWRRRTANMPSVCTS